jgi:hypothetical protein
MKTQIFTVLNTLLDSINYGLIVVPKTFFVGTSIPHVAMTAEGGVGVMGLEPLGSGAAYLTQDHAVMGV